MTQPQAIVNLIGPPSSANVSTKRGRLQRWMSLRANDQYFSLSSLVPANLPFYIQKGMKGAMLKTMYMLIQNGVSHDIIYSTSILSKILFLTISISN